MKTSATAAGVYFPASGQLGYNVVINGPQATIYKVTAVKKDKPRTGVSHRPDAWPVHSSHARGSSHPGRRCSLL